LGLDAKVIINCICDNHLLQIVAKHQYISTFVGFENMGEKGKYSYIFFDLDRTLWDFDSSALMAFEEIFEKHKLNNRGVNSVEEFLKFYNIHNEELWAQYRVGKITKEKLRGLRFLLTLNEYGIDNKELAEAIGLDYVKISPLKVSLFSNAFEILDYLKLNYQLFLITNGFSEVQATKLKVSGLGKYFKTVITSEEAGCKKPDPCIFDYAIQKSGAIVEQSIMIGDDPEVDILGARNFGMDQVLFDPGKKYNQNGSTFYINGLIELKDIL
jgi:putative hydrolase of the HAD superfamily